MNGVLVVDKPSGPTSHDIVARVRRAIGISRVGHTGTLDPLATGVLPLVIGRATRLAQFLTAEDKEYLADLRLGAATPTYDAEHRLKDRANSNVSAVKVDRATIESHLGEFSGTYWQTPPAFSAKKIRGTRAHRLARAKKPVALKPVRVTVTALELLSIDSGLARIRIVCSSGFYVRSLAHEVGERLGCGAHLEALKRTRSGVFTIADATTLEAIEHDKTEALGRLIPMDRLLGHLSAVVVNIKGVRRVVHGNVLSSADLAVPFSAQTAAPFRLFDEQGVLLGIAEPRPGGLLHPVIVLV